ncbi:hypothetical protein [Pseudomonas sp. CGJS7]|uniref:hypothetical protein n=1 Tax=Pseudomonas sp. CGJS7 TaxID=3109348 RepID=UPI00300A9D0A
MKRLISGAISALCLLALGACAQSASDRSKASGPASSTEKQSVGYDVAELQRRLLSKIASLQGYEDIQPEAVQKSLGLKLLPSPTQPLNQEGIGELSNGWVFKTWAWKAEPGTLTEPLQLFFYPGNEADFNLWLSDRCFVDTAAMIAELQSAGYKATGERLLYPRYSVEMERTTPSAKFIVKLGSYRPQHASKSKRCLSEITAAVRPASSTR